MSPNSDAVPIVPGGDSESAASSQDAACRRTRSRSGCYTCRRRKKACDGQRPVCNACCRLEIPCVFPRPNERKKLRSTSTSRQDSDNLLQNPVVSDGVMLATDDGSQVDGITDADGQIDWTSIDDIFGLSSASPLRGGVSPFDWTFLVPSSDDDLVGSQPADNATKAIVDVPPMSSNVKAHRALSVSNGQTTGMSDHTQERNDAIIPNPAPLAPSLQGLPPGVTSTAPLLLDYFINTFSSIISVLGPQENVLLRHLLPLASSSPIIMCGVIGWSASHLATIGQPFAGIAQANTSAMEIQVDSLAGDLSQDKSMEAMLTILMIGGAEICRGDVRGWNQRLTTARTLLLAAQERSSGRLSNEWLGIACNTIYHDVLSAVATKKDLYVPVDQYRKILDPMLEPDTYMGAGMQIFSALGDIVNLAAKASAVQGSVELLDVVAEAKGIQTRLDGTIPPRECCNLERLHLVHAFQAYRSTAQLLVRQIVLRSAPCDLETRMLVQRTMSELRLVLDTPSETQMLLPVFVLGVDTVGKVGRTEVTSLLDRFNSRVMMGNIKSVHQLLVKVWARNEDGDRWVDWRALADEVSRVSVTAFERQSNEQEDCAISFG